MRHLTLILLSSFLTACATVKTTEQNNVGDTPAGSLPTEEVKARRGNSSDFSLYLRDYLSKNIEHRVKTSRNLIDRSNIEGNGRLPSKSLFQSLGYRTRDALVTMPPELSSRIYSNPEKLLITALVQDLETAWALLDSTKARLGSTGGLEKGRQDWEVAVTRRNLLLDGVSYWYQLRNQETFNSGIARLGETTNGLFNTISKDREFFDVEDLRGQELALLGLKEDIALLFQYYSSEQARLFNRIDSFNLPKRKNSDVNFNKSLSCPGSSKTQAQEKQLLSIEFSSQINKIFSTNNKKTFVYELNSLAREVSSKALKLHAKKLNEIEDAYNANLEQEKLQRQTLLDALIEKNKEKAALGEDVDLTEVEALKSAPFNSTRQKYVSTQKLDYYKNSVDILAKWAADELLQLNQTRLKDVITNLGAIYHVNEESTWKNSTDAVNLIRDLLYDIYDETLIDYLLGYERTVFLNNAMLHGCRINTKINSHELAINPKIIDQLSFFIETYYQKGLVNSSLKQQQQNFKNVTKALSAKKLGQGYQRINKSVNNKESGGLKEKLKRNSITLASKSEVIDFVQGQGFTIEVGQFNNIDSAIKMVRRFKVSVPKIIYGLRNTKNELAVFKVLVGSEVNYESVKSMKKRIGFGEIKEFSEIRKDVDRTVDQAKASQQSSSIKNSNDISRIQLELARHNFTLASNQDVLEFTQTKGYTIEVAQLNDVDSTITMLKRFNVNVPKLVYLSPNESGTSDVFKVLIGSEKRYKSITQMKDRIGFGEIKELSQVRSEYQK